MYSGGLSKHLGKVFVSEVMVFFSGCIVLPPYDQRHAAHVAR